MSAWKLTWRHFVLKQFFLAVVFAALAISSLVTPLGVNKSSTPNDGFSDFMRFIERGGHLGVFLFCAIPSALLFWWWSRVIRRLRY